MVKLAQQSNESLLNVMQKTASSALAVKPSTVSAGVGYSSLDASSHLSSSAAEKNQQWQRELLMERIRSHASQQKSFPELSKLMRMSMLEKRYALDTVEKSNLQKCLDSMQHCIKVTSRQGLVERLESLSRQLGLKFMEDTAGLFISTDMFYLEIILDASGALTDVKVHHECKIEQQSCSELVNCLNRGDFADFTVQLEGLSSIYQLNAEPKVKKKAFVALQAMETDLYNLYQVQNFSKDTRQLIESSSVGLVLKRRGGHPMKLTYFVAPYDLISLTEKCLQPLTLDLVSTKDIGMSVTVNLEAASANKLQVLPTVTFVKDPNTGVETPVYAPLTQLNSTLLPAIFVLRLNKPLPVCSATLRALFPCAPVNGENGKSTGAKALEQNSGPTSTSRENPTTIMNLIVQTFSEQQLKNSSKGLFVCLPDQTHCYFFTDNKKLKATLVTYVPFTEPSQVPVILAFLKKQALFYSLLSSCVRPQAKMGNDMDTTTILEVNAISFQQISVSLQHSFEESMATVDFNLNDSNVNCSIYSSNRNYDLLSIKLTNIVQKSLSIPVTLRALLKFWEQERMKIYQRSVGGGVNTSNSGSGGNTCNNNGGGQANSSYGNFSLAMGPNDPGGGGGIAGGGSGVVCNNVNVAAKQDTNTTSVPDAQSPFLTNTSNAAANVTAAAGISGYLKFKTEHIKQEDFHESPKSATQTPTVTQMQSVEASSLGQIINAQQQQQTADIATLAADLEIADKYKNIWKDKTTNLKNSVSITPILHGVPAAVPTCESSPVLSGSNMEIKRSGIEIIPLLTQNAPASIHNSNGSGSNTTTNTSPASSSTTITITPINSSVQQHSIPKNEKKSNTISSSTSSTIACSNSSSSKRNLVDATSTTAATEQKEKKRSKKKRDDSPMGPPEKVFSRQNSPATISTACPDTVARKFSSPSSSPKGSSGGLLASTTVGTSASTISSRPSPKHSPVYTSPKHQSTASNSPKSPFGTHSPKHGSSGKPSMSTLKSAAASLSPKADKTNSNLVAAGVGSVVSGGGVGGVGGGLGVAGVCMGGGSVATTGSIVNAASTSSTGVLGRPMSSMSGVVSTASVNNAFVSATTAAAKLSTCVGASAVGKTNAVSSSINIQQMKTSSSNINHLSVSSSGLGGVGAFNEVVASVGGVGGGGGVGIGTTVASAPTLDSVSRKTTVSSAVSLMTSTIVSSATAATVAAGVEAAAAAAATTITTTTAAAHPQHGNTEKLINDEYRVKQSQEGLKLTINKTSNKSNSFNSISSKTKMTCNVGLNVELSAINQSPTKKQHTGLKPGVNSGPASSKKSASVSPQTSQNTRNLFQKSYSSGNLSTKLLSHVTPTSTTVRGSSSNNHPDLYRKLSKKNVERDRECGSSALSSSSSQPATRLDHHADMMKILQFASPTMAANMEGFMKNLSTKFQIPKLSQRAGTTNITTATTDSIVVIAKSTAPTTSTNVSSSSPTVFSNTTLDTETMLQQQAYQHYQNQQQLQHQHLLNTIRPPPPPYHAAIAASGTKDVRQSAAAAGATNGKVDQNVPATVGDDTLLANKQVDGK